jgi:hypothetical protein
MGQFCVADTCWQGEGEEQYLNLDISKYKNENLVTLGILRSPEFTPPPPYNDRTNDPAYFQSCSVSNGPAYFQSCSISNSPAYFQSCLVSKYRAYFQS